MLPEPAFAPDPRGAVALMAGVLETSTEPVVLVPTGPLTNIATLLSERPDLGGRIGRIVMMGGSMGPGNVTPVAETNVYVDPEAASVVLESGLRVTMVGLDVTHQALATPQRRKRMREVSHVGETAADILGFFAGRYEEGSGFWAPPVHDAVAVAAQHVGFSVRYRTGAMGCFWPYRTGPMQDAGYGLPRISLLKLSEKGY